MPLRGGARRPVSPVPDAGPAPGETTLIYEIRDITEMVYAMMGGLLEMGWVPPGTGGTAFRMALWRTHVPTLDWYNRLP